eukprot:5928022-Amphidinium_carterae.1
MDASLPVASDRCVTISSTSLMASSDIWVRELTSLTLALGLISAGRLAAESKAFGKPPPNHGGIRTWSRLCCGLTSVKGAWKLCHGHEGA